MDYTELAQKLQEVKDMIDDAYDTTKNKYGEVHAKHAMLSYFINYQSNGFTRDNYARENMKSLLYRPNEFIQILLDYAISSYLSNNMTCDMTNEEINQYISDKEGKLDYSGNKAVKIVALVTGMNTFHAVHLLSLNPKLRSELVLSFVSERYSMNKRQQLDTGRRSKMIKVEGYPHSVMISKDKLNNDIRNMNNDDEYEEYIIPHKSK